MLSIKDIKNNQVFYGKDSKGEYHDFKAWDDATFVDGKWIIDCTDSGDYCYTFDESDEYRLFAAEYEQKKGRVSGRMYTVAVPPKD